MRILVVEDEIGITNFLKQGLEEEGYEVLIATDGMQGLAIFQEEHLDLVLLDWMMPKLTGLELCTIIRDTDSKLPVIFLTAKDTVRETIEGLRAGANDYIKKPFSFEELLERIKIHFREVPESNTLSLGDITLNLDTFEVFRSTKAINFTQREFELLRYLIEHKGKIRSRDQIIEDVWQISFEYDSGVIDVFMNAIRKKLNLKKEDPHIKTIRGVGFIANDF